MELLIFIIIMIVLFCNHSSLNRKQKRDAMRKGSDCYVSASGKILDIRTDKPYKTEYQKQTEREFQNLLKARQMGMSLEEYYDYLDKQNGR